MGKTGKATVYLVFDQNYQVVGVTTPGQMKYGSFSDGPVIVVGPIVIGEPINWDELTEEAYGSISKEEKLSDYVYMKDGVPPIQLSSYEDFGKITH